MKYTFSLMEGAAHRVREKIVLESRAGESDRHIALKVLAYVLFRDETGGIPLRIEQNVGQRHKPDLVATDPVTEQVVLWIDCGDIGVKRLGRIAAANPRARVVVVKSTRNEATAYARTAERYLPPPGRGAAVIYLGFDEVFLPAFRAALRGTNLVAVSQTEATLEVEINSVPLVTTLHRV